MLQLKTSLLRCTVSLMLYYRYLGKSTCSLFANLVGEGQICQYSTKLGLVGRDGVARWMSTLVEIDVMRSARLPFDELIFGLVLCSSSVMYPKNSTADVYQELASKVLNLSLLSIHILLVSNFCNSNMKRGNFLQNLTFC